MVVVYGNFANGGYRVKPYAIERIETQRGRVVYQARRTKIQKVLDKDTAGMMTAMLRKVIKEGTGKGADIGKPMGGKTGTTNENKDAWFIGYTPDIVTGVFIGNDDNKSIGLTGGSAPARIWKDMMTVATEPYGSPEFDYEEVDLTVIYDSSSSQDIAEDEDAESDTPTSNQNTNTENTTKNENQEKNTVIQKDVKPEPLPESFKTIPIQLSTPIEATKRQSSKPEGIIPLPNPQ